MSDDVADARLGLWKRPQLIYLGMAYGMSWAIWIAAWLVSQRIAAGDLLINADLVRALFFDDNATATLVWVSLLSLLGVYGPMIAGIVATRIDPASSPLGDRQITHLRRRRVPFGQLGRAPVSAAAARIALPPCAPCRAGTRRPS